MSLDIAISDTKSVRLLEVEGRIDSVSADQLQDALTKSIKNHIHLVVALDKVEYMSSAGLRELVKALKALHLRGGDLRLASPSERVMEVLELAGLDTIFKIYPSHADAINSY